MKFWEEIAHVRGKQMEERRAQSIKDREQTGEEDLVTEPTLHPPKKKSA